MQSILLWLSGLFASPTVTPAPLEVGDDPSGRRYLVVREGYSVKELAGGHPAAPGRRHVFADVGSFANFIEKHLPSGADTEILADTDCIVAVSGATWRRDQLSCVLTKHPEFLGWEKLLATPNMPQLVLVREIIARRHTLVPSEQLLATLQSLDLSNVTEATFKINDNGNYDVKGQRSTTQMSVKLPGTFTVKVPIYLDGHAIAITVGLVIESTEGASGPKFSLRAHDLDMAKLLAYRNQVDNLRGLLGETYLVGAGKLQLEA